MDAGNDWIFQRDPDNLFIPNKTTPKSFFDDTVEEVDISQGISEVDMLMQKYPGMNVKLATQIANDTNPKRKSDVIAMVEQTLEMGSRGMGGDEIIEIFKKTPRTKQADGGQATSTGLNYLLGEDDINSRVPYAAGGRRGFLKLLGGLGAAGVAFKTGLLGLGKGVAKPAAKVAAEAATGTAPPHFFKLVAKIKALGDDVTETAALAERQNVKTYKDFELTEDIATGRQEIIRYKQSDEATYYGQPLTEETYMAYTPGETIIGKGNKPVKTLDDYEEGTAFVRNDRGYTGEIVEESTTIADDIFEEVSEEIPEIIRKEKAVGGIITKLIKKLNAIDPGSTKRGKLSKPMSKKAKDKKALREAIENFSKRNRGR